MRSCAALSKRGVIFRPMTRRSNCSISSCVRSRRIGKCRRGNGQRRKRNSPSCSTHGSSQHDGQPAPHTKYLTLPSQSSQIRRHELTTSLPLVDLFFGEGHQGGSHSKGNCAYTGNRRTGTTLREHPSSRDASNM